MHRANDSTRSEDPLLIEDHGAVPSSPTTLDREGVLAALGYHHSEKVKVWEPRTFFDAKESCQRCGKKVYPVERVDVGMLYHRGCFKCKVCGVQLTLRNFQLEVEPGEGGGVGGGAKKQLFCNVHVPSRHTKGQFGQDALEIQAALEAQKKTSAKGKKAEHGEGWEYDANALEFQHLRRDQNDLGVKRPSLKRRSTLRSWQDFEKYGVFDAQNSLEKIHREEEDELYRQIFDERRQHIRLMEREIQAEKEMTVRELVAHFEHKRTRKEERKAGLAKVENYYKNVRQERMRILLQRLAAEEQAAVTRMIEKHSQEMLVLIAEKESQALQTLREERNNRAAKESSPSKTTPRSSDGSLDSSGKSRKHNALKERQQTAAQPQSRPASQRVVDGRSANSQNLLVTDHGVIRQPHPGKGPPPGSGYTGQSNRPQNQTPPQSVRPQQVPHTQPPSPVRKPTPQHQTPRVHQQTQGGTPLGQSPQVQPQTPTKSSRSNATTPGSATSQPRSQSKETTFGVTQDTRPVITVNRDYKITPSTGYWQEEEDSFDDEEDEVTEQKRLSELRKVQQQQEQQRRQRDQKDLERKRQQQQQQQQQQQLQRRKQQQRQRQQRQQQQYSDDDEESQSETSEEDSEMDDGSYSEDSSFSEASYYPDEMQKRDKGSDASRGSGSNSSFDPTVDISTLSKQPEVKPPKNSKSDLYKTPAVFKVQDRQAIEEAQREPKSFTDLVRRLSRRCENELQRARSIFRWITAKDLNKMRFDENLNPDSPMGLLRGIKFGTESYHNLFKRLCSYAGIHCQVIEGYSKGAGYRPGTPFQNMAYRNQWTAVWIRDAWRFINSNWGARHLKGTRDEVMTYRCDEFYFLTDPEEHIYQHFPDLPHWQLLKESITLEQFTALPVVKSPFFNNKLRFSIPTNAVLNVPDGLVEVGLDMSRYVSAAAKVRSRNSAVPTNILNERTLVRCKKRQITISVNLPCPGDYYLDVYIGGMEDDRMDNACSFMIHCLGVSSDAHVSYPQVGMFGATPAFKLLGMNEHSHPDPLITVSGDVALAFTLTKDVKLSHTLQLWNKRDRVLEGYDRYGLLKLRTPNMAAFLVRCPRRGHYVFALYGAEEDSGPSDMPCIYRCLIDCKHPAEDARPMPKMSKRWKNCKLVEPLTEELAPDTRVMFKIESKLAVEMAVVNNNKWTSLERTGERWQAGVTTAGQSGKLLVCGRFDRSKDKFIPLIEYRVKDQVDDMRAETQKLTAYLSYDHL